MNILLFALAQCRIKSTLFSAFSQFGRSQALLSTDPKAQRLELKNSWRRLSQTNQHLPFFLFSRLFESHYLLFWLWTHQIFELSIVRMLKYWSAADFSSWPSLFHSLSTQTVLHRVVLFCCIWSNPTNSR